MKTEFIKTMIKTGLLSPIEKHFKISRQDWKDFSLSMNPEKDLKSAHFSLKSGKEISLVNSLGDSLRPFEFLAKHIPGEIKLIKLIIDQSDEGEEMRVEIFYIDRVTGEKVKQVKPF